MLIQEPVHAAIWHCLNHYAYADAIFLSERLFFEVGSDESLHLLATCYYRSGKPSQAYHLLSSQGARTPQNKFLLARCCLDLEKLSEVESLFPSGEANGPAASGVEDIVSEFGDAASFALKLLAQVCSETERTEEAISAERRALELNPFLWKSFESLCARGDHPDPATIFSVSNVDSFLHVNGLNPILQYANGIPGGGSAGPVTHATAAAPAVAMPPATSHNFATPLTTVTSTPITGSAVPVFNQLADKTSQPAVPVVPLAELAETPQQTGLPVPQLMSLITPVQNAFESTVGGLDSCLTASPMADTFRMMSGFDALNVSTDIDSSHAHTGGGHLPPQAPQLGRRRRPPQSNTSCWPVMNLNRALGLENSGPGNSQERSFGVLPHGTLSWSNHGVRLNAESQHVRTGGVRLDFSSLAVLSPYPEHMTSSSAQDAGGMLSTPGINILTSPYPSGSDAANQSNNALINSTNNEQKISKRGLAESNAMRWNVFTPSSQNNSIQNVTPMTAPPPPSVGSGSIGVSATAPGVAALNSGSIPNVRRSNRLFVSSQQSKSKENSKGVTAAPSKSSRVLRSPSRKSKAMSMTSNRFMSSSTPQPISGDLEKNNEKNKEKTKKESATVNNVNNVMTAMTTHKPQNPMIPSEQLVQIMSAQALVIQRHCVEGLLQLLQQLGAAYYELNRFNCRKAVQLLEDVPSKHRNTPWVLGHLGKAHFELGKYKEAKSLFRELRDMDPYQMEFMEYYSTTLWHLQEEVELSVLAQELTRLNKLSPQAWCAAGNCFSRQKEHENSIKFFNRAIQVDPKFAYAYTLLGHEYVMIEELDKALNCFRGAVRADPRHYNAWYGIGLTYYKQERFSLAEYYYRKAVAINPQSPVLMCHVAVVQHALKKTDKALETLEMAIKAAPHNLLCKFEKASILFSCERYQDALKELNLLKSLAPKESSVYFLIGKVHNKLNNTHLALMHFSWAMDLDPKVANSQIKDALDPTLNRIGHDDPSANVVDDLYIEDEDESTVNDGSSLANVTTEEEDIVMMQQDESPQQNSFSQPTASSYLSVQTAAGSSSSASAAAVASVSLLANYEPMGGASDDSL